MKRSEFLVSLLTLPAAFLMPKWAVAKDKITLWGFGFRGRDKSIHYGFRDDNGTEVYVTYRKIDTSIADDPHWMDDPKRNRSKREVALDDSLAKELYWDLKVNSDRYRHHSMRWYEDKSCPKELPQILRQIADKVEKQNEEK